MGSDTPRPECRFARKGEAGSYAAHHSAALASPSERKPRTSPPACASYFFFSLTLRFAEASLPTASVAVTVTLPRALRTGRKKGQTREARYNVDGLSTRDAATVAGIGERALKSRLHRGQRAMLERLDNDSLATHEAAPRSAPADVSPRPRTAASPRCRLRARARPYPTSGTPPRRARSERGAPSTPHR